VAAVYFALFVWVLASLIAPRRERPPAPAGPAESPRVLPVAAVCTALAACFAVTIAALASATTHPPGSLSSVARLPIRVLSDAGAGDAETSNVMQALALAEAALLYLLYRLLAGRRVTPPVVALVGATFAAFLVGALASPASQSTDAYGYVSFALQPGIAYAPQGIPFTGDHAVLNGLFGTPRPAAYYGPLWIWFSHLVVAPFPTLVAQLYALRAVEALALIACIALLARLGVPFATLALVAVDPTVFLLWIVDGHNDLAGVALVLAGAALGASPAARVALVAAAGLVKLPLVAIGAVVFASEPSRVRRFALPAAAVVLCVAASLAFGGRAYAVHLLTPLPVKPPTAAERLLHACDALVAVAALAVALAARRFTFGTVWVWPALAGFVAPWYGVWCLPYALASGTLAAFLIAEPAVAYLSSWNYVATPFSIAGSVALVFGPLLAAAFARVRRSGAARRPSHPRGAIS
jgi:hypothetical protein